MDHTLILNQIRSVRNIDRAFHFAYADRYHVDYYFDHFDRILSPEQRFNNK